MNPPLRPAIGIAHRGFSPDGAENSMTAFQAAVDLGYRHLETDARVTGDGVALAFHDPILDRVTNSRGELRRLSWREVRTARILDREPIPRLEEVLSAFGGGVSVNIDVKSDAAVGPTLDAIRRTNAWHRVRLAAFSPARLLQLRRSAGPGTPSALTATEVLALRHGRLGLLPGPPRRTGLAAQVPPRVGPLEILQPRFLAAARARAIEVHAWTVNRRPEMVRLLDLGVDAIITDRADLLRDVLRERGQWPG
ncbi:glycerophosphodiester phosphodiesterase family protein [Jatrophihabitans sp.]|jgi:glycerophosphoryl diester phosphodiesterase|uniref:glycerophosphodiester phosphodiesterase family protein n=1 Tax=Jatrophihabitans sp. TaxID=1932789 RepID=UPI002EF95216